MAEIYPELKRVVNKLIEDGILPRRYRARVLDDVSEAFKQQMRIRYTYLLGEWCPNRKKRAKSAKTGRTVSMAEVRRYVDAI